MHKKAKFAIALLGSINGVVQSSRTPVFIPAARKPEFLKTCVGFIVFTIAFTAITFAQTPPQLALRQTASAVTSNDTCYFDYSVSPTLVTCSGRPTSMTLSFNPTAADSSLLIVALHGAAGCVDNQGRVWIGSILEYIGIRQTGYLFFTPPTDATAGLTSVTCDVSTTFSPAQTPDGNPQSSGYSLEEILQFFEVATVGGNLVLADKRSIYSHLSTPDDVCRAIAPENGLAIAGVQLTQNSTNPTNAILSGQPASNNVVYEFWSPSPTWIHAQKSAYTVSSGGEAAMRCDGDNCVCFTATFKAVVKFSALDLGCCEDRNASVGHPINVTNGNTYIEAEDYNLPGLGGGIILHRTWNSLRAAVGSVMPPGLFGDGWRSSYEERLLSTDPTHLKYWRADGSVWSFLSVNGAWQLQSPSNENVTLAFDSITAEFILTFRDGSQKVFSQTGYLAAVKDRNGNNTRVTYDSSNRIIQVTDAGGRWLTFTYNDSSNPNQVTTIGDAVGIAAAYAYDSTSHLLQVQYPDATTNSYVYDSAGLLTSVVDNESKLLEAHTYDAQRRGVSSQRANGVDLVSVAYGANGTAQVTDSFGNSSLYGVTKIADRGKVSSFLGTTCASCGAQEGRGEYIFDARGNRTSTKDALDNVTTLTYDSFNDMRTRSMLVGGNTLTWSYTYNSLGEVLTATDPLGFVTTNTYDVKGNLLTTTTPSPGGHEQGSRTSFTYDTKGQLRTVTDPLNHATTFTYTPAGLVETVTDAQGKVTRFEYDGRANRAAIIDALNQRTTFTYDSRNRLTRITYPTTPATSTSFAYDSRGRRTSVTDANGKTTTYSYDDADRLIAVTDGQTPAGITRYEYDSENNLIGVTDALGRPTRFEYDARRRVTKTIFPSNLPETYSYDEVDNLIGKTDRKNQTISYRYDALRRLTRKEYPDGKGIDYTYDAASRLTQIADVTGTYQFTYDNMGRLTQTSTGYSFIPGKIFTVGYGWNAASDPLSMEDPQGGSTTYTYDTLNRLITLKNPQRNQFAFAYDALGRRTQLARPNSINTNYQYDSLSRLTSLLHQFTTNKGATTTLDGAAYSYDAAGNRLSRTDSRTNVTSNYGYDPLYQLTSVTQAGSTMESYTFDAVGNRLSSLGGVSYTYNTSNQLLTSQPGVTYTYDANGNLESKGTTTYSWDFEYRLTRVTQPGGAQVNFKYDPMGRRIQKSSSSGTVNYVYDGANILEEVDAVGNLLTRYTQGLGADKPVAILKSGTTSYYEADGLGSVTSLSNSSGALASTYTYDSFGRLTASSGTTINSYRFTGRELDSETGLYYYRARYYDAQIGRFISEDPIQFRGGNNFYDYVHNNPINLTDPLGLCATPERVNCSLPALPSRIGGDRVQKMVKEANDFFTVMSNPALGNPAGAMPALLGFLTGKFRPRGEWDYKSQYDPKNDPVNREKARAFGNFAFGAVMQSLDFSYYETQNAAGIAQIGIKTLGGAAGTGYPFFRYPFGDQVGDAQDIKRGWAYQRDCPQ